MQNQLKKLFTNENFLIKISFRHKSIHSARFGINFPKAIFYLIKANTCIYYCIVSRIFKISLSLFVATISVNNVSSRVSFGEF